jgi:hypothetical protein
MATNYNLVIVGAGVSGLALANHALSINPKQKIIIIDKDKTIGGCHKVNRKKYNNESYFCEHGPRGYCNNYVNFIGLLKSMNINFYDIFNKHYSLFDVSNKIIFTDKIFTFTEILYIIRDFIFVIFANKHGINTSMKTYMDNNNFSQKAKDYVDLFCRSLDGGGIDRISLNQFISSSIQSMLYSIYTPKIPNDEGLFKYWKQYLEMNKITFIVNNGIDKIIEKKDRKEIEKIILNDKKTEIKGDKFVFALPPSSLIKILDNNENTNIQNAFGDLKKLKEMAELTEYDEYISITFHWDYHLNLIDDVEKFNTQTEWGLAAMNMSKSMTFKEAKSKTVISCAVIYPNKKSSFSNKTANECEDENELVANVYEQLRTIYKNISKPTLFFINNYYNKKEKKWVSNEESYIKVPNVDYLSYTSTYKNFYNLGTHNGKHKNSFTSVESAISNSIKLANIIYDKKIKIRRCFDIRDLIIVILSFIILLLIIRYNYGK